jgi:starch phosphorylase
MRLPFVAVGLLYRRGYFNQSIDRHGNQHANYANLEAGEAPVSPARDSGGNEIYVNCRVQGADVAVKVWEAEVGRIPVLLLDTDIEQNHAKAREITRVLYDGGEERRIQQELILGIGGVRALRATGREPRVWHVNEGHAAFQALERTRELVSSGLGFTEAREAVAANTVFTTHTPVAAGHDVFHRDLLLNYFRDFAGELGLTEDEFLRLGADGAAGQEFNMTQLAINMARAVNGVSRIHGTVSAEICAAAWPEVPPAENPVGFVTNGVHVPTFIEQEWTDLFEQQIGAGWAGQLTSGDLAQRVEEIPDGRYWYAHQRVKCNMLIALRDRLMRQYVRNNVSDAHVKRLLKFLNPDDPEVLTIGFARRFATYKRATLLFRDLGWLKQIVDTDTRPVVFLFAGKAHPADKPGQDMLREVHRISNEPGFVGKILLVEGYDMGLGRLLTAGVDIWLNTPIAPLEASGTSGMKAAINGTVNLSVLDGWWAEAFDGTNGWGIPPSVAEDPAERDAEDAQTFYETLQDEVIPLYYDRASRSGISEGWVARSKRSMVTVLPHFNSRRVLHDYLVGYYGPAAGHGARLAADDYRLARDLSAWKERVHSAWPGIQIHLLGSPGGSLLAGETLRVGVSVDLAGLEPEDVRVECVVHRVMCSEVMVPLQRFASHGPFGDGVRELDGEPVYVAPFEPAAEPAADGRYEYHLSFTSPWSGAMRYEIRAVPQHPALLHPYETGLMRWL